MLPAHEELAMVEKTRRGSAGALSSNPGAIALLLPGVLLALPGCGMLRGTEDVKALPASEVKFAIEAPCTAPAAQSAVEGAGRELELDVEEASQKPGDPWVLRRGPRLNDPPLFYRVDILRAAGREDAAMVHVYAVPVSRGVTDTQETLSKPAALAMRIVAACAAGGAR
jgi:hypothetical protein